ncbi:SRPBCC domain-containing protein [Sphingobacterium sp. HJSM2_6]|uniref:SRPBCC domain-containing protein n=1 Tax=Sphingobacterium sp. HJSM2_6 TaxID=3366264 RepID=UPI003BC53F8C
MAKNQIHIVVRIKADIKKVWDSNLKAEVFDPLDKQDREWYCPEVQNDFRVGGKFKYHLVNQDKRFDFKFSGVYTEIIPYEKISFEFDKKRKASYHFKVKEGLTEVNLYIEPDGIHSIDLQKAGWEVVIGSFKTYVENL